MGDAAPGDLGPGGLGNLGDLGDLEKLEDSWDLPGDRGDPLASRLGAKGLSLGREEIMKKLCGREPEQEKSEQGVPVPAHACGECASTSSTAWPAWLGEPQRAETPDYWYCGCGCGGVASSAAAALMGCFQAASDRGMQRGLRGSFDTFESSEGRRRGGGGEEEGRRRGGACCRWRGQ